MNKSEQQCAQRNSLVVRTPNIFPYGACSLISSFLRKWQERAKKNLFSSSLMESVEQAKGALGKGSWVIRAYLALASEGGLRLAGRRTIRKRQRDGHKTRSTLRPLEIFFVLLSSSGFPQKGLGEPGRSGDRVKVRDRFADLGWEK